MFPGLNDMSDDCLALVLYCDHLCRQSMQTTWLRLFIVQYFSPVNTDGVAAKADMREILSATLDSCAGSWPLATCLHSSTSLERHVRTKIVLKAGFHGFLSSWVYLHQTL